MKHPFLPKSLTQRLGLDFKNELIKLNCVRTNNTIRIR